MLPPGIRTAGDLVTSKEATCAGFLAQATAKTLKANPYVEDAFFLWEKLATKKSIDEAVSDFFIKEHLISAAGFSDKAQNYFNDRQLTDALKEMFKEPKGEQSDPAKFRIEIFSRYLLTKGDSLGGEMRNFTGAEAGRKLAEAIILSLNAKGIKPIITKDKKTDKIQRISWDKRLLAFDIKSPLVGKNVDVTLLDISDKKVAHPTAFKMKELYLAMGELKGGIDPAGADEHWKTANKALDRMRKPFVAEEIITESPVKGAPKLFFVGAAIADAMATEIFEELQSGKLTYAANLTKENQLKDLADWLVSL